MKKFAVALLLSSAVMWAQSTTPQTPPPGAQGQTGAGAAHSMHQHGTGQGQGVGQGMGQHMDMQAMIDQMRTKLDRMRTSLANVKDPAAKEALQADYDMWHTMFGHMQQMQSMMKEHMGGQGMMGHEGMMQPGTTGGTTGTMPMHSHPQGTTPGTTNPSTPTQTPPPQSQTPPPTK